MAPAPAGDTNQVWVAGHYTYVSGQWNWVSGSWQRPPNPGAAWVPGRYDAQTKRWTEGHWDTNANANSRRLDERE
jgi:hypothetical protein